MSVFLCGNTGCINRGCEAIIRSTVKVINQRHSDIYLGTYSPDQDRNLIAEIGINMIPYEGYPSKVFRLFCGGVHKVYPGSTLHHHFIQRGLWSRISKDDICLNIGGDTYCYDRPETSIALNKYAYRHKIKSILWCCSIEEDKMRGEILKDLKRYSYIFAREQITYSNLLQAGIPENKVIRCCDPAFFLDIKETELPTSFVCGNTIGLNVSEIIVKSNNDKVYQAIIEFLEYILESTDMGICLIPHVYSIKENKCDYPILKRIYDDLANPRISIIEKELTCEELKYVISNCRFMITARTHASIAAYSTGVPTLVLGYSVKSKGIAKDLFGRSENYVIPYTEINDAGELIAAFEYIFSNEKNIKQKLSSIMPAYKETLLSAIRNIFPDPKNEKLCDRRLCTGCGVCEIICPQKCIQMVSDSSGFLYPFVDKDKCNHCGLCRKTCPVLNRVPDDGTKPDAYAVWHKDETVRKTSSSGGAFYAMGNAILKQGGVVFGAAFDDDFQVKHKCCESTDELAKLQGSKYVQSNMENAYKMVSSVLAEKRSVLFSGTPCQIAALKQYLNSDSERLFTVECICHGVPSPGLWDSYIRYREDEVDDKLLRVSFRDKTEGWKNFSLSMTFDNGKNYRENVGEDPYLRFFVQGYSLRDSCSLCPFKNMHRSADITMADFWNVTEILPDIQDDNKGVSLILIQSDKGRQLLHAIDNQVESTVVDFLDAIKHNESYLQNKPEALCHRAFLNLSKDIDFGKLEKQFDTRREKGRIRYYIEAMRVLFS